MGRVLTNIYGVSIIAVLAASYFRVSYTDVTRDRPCQNITRSERERDGSEIRLEHQLVHFSQDRKTIAWSVFEKVTNCNISPLNASYSLTISDCDPKNISVPYNNLNEATITIQSQELADDYINITYPDARITINQLFQIKPEVVTKELLVYEGSERTCITVPEPDKGPHVPIPASPRSGKRDIECRAVPSNSITIGNCVSLKDECNARFNDSIFTRFIEICNDSSILKICFSNVSREMNNTKYHFYYSSSPMCPTTGKREHLKHYIDSYQLKLVATNFSADINTTNGEICFTTQQTNLSQSFLVNISIYDVTGYLTYQETDVVINNNTCIQPFESVFAQLICEPFHVKIESRLGVQFLIYNKTAGNNDSNFTKNPCQCANENVDLQIHQPIPGDNYTSTSILYTCNSTYLTDVNIEIKLSDSETKSVVHKNIICTHVKRENRSISANLQCGVTYSITPYVMFPHFSIKCELLPEIKRIFNICPDGDDGDTEITIIIIIVVVILLFFVLGPVLVIVLSIWLNRKCKRKSNPELSCGYNAQQEHVQLQEPTN